MKRIVLTGASVLGLILSASLVAQQVVPSSRPTVPRDQHWNPTGGEDLSQAQKDAVEAIKKEFKNYVKTHPDAAPEMRAIQEVWDKERFKKGEKGVEKRWRTLPDEYNICDFGMMPCYAIWQTPGGGRPGGGGEYPPRTILVGDLSAEGCDPRVPGQMNCLRRALAIVSMFREGGRVLQQGRMEHGVMDCTLLRSVVKQNNRVISVINDINTNGVPGSPHGAACQLGAQEQAAMNSVARGLQRDNIEHCQRAQAQNCNPMPEGC